MKILFSPSEVEKFAKRIVFAAGFFDGVHVGHRKLLKEAKAIAESKNAELWILTFDPHPLAIVKPDYCPKLITPFAYRIELLEQYGAAGCLVLPFTNELALTSPEAFCDKCFAYWYSNDAQCTVVAGPNWHFGHKQAASIYDIPKLTDGRVAAHVVDGELYDSILVSSSRIRQALIEGDLSKANAMLGYYYTIADTTIKERGVGSELGFPTANIVFQNGVLPPNGVYATRVTLPEAIASTNSAKSFFAVANLGFRPTFPDARPDTPILELHLLDFDSKIPLHGTYLKVEFIEFIRREQKFDTPVELVKQIKQDIMSARAIAAAIEK